MRRLFLSLPPPLLLAAACALAASAPDAPEAMTMKLAHAAHPRCEPDCAEWIALEGPFTAQSAPAFRRLIASLGPRRLPIVIQSPGGDVRAALTMGRLLRQKGLDVAVGATHFLSDARSELAPDGAAPATIGRESAWCNSACAMFLAGAVGRSVGLGAYVGVHQIKVSTKQMWVHRQYRVRIWRRGAQIVRREREVVDEAHELRVFEDRKARASLFAEVRDYFARMGVDQLVADIMARTPHESAHLMTPAELDSSHLRTLALRGDALAALYARRGVGQGVHLAGYRARSRAAEIYAASRMICALAPTPQRPHCVDRRKYRRPSEPPFLDPRDAALPARIEGPAPRPLIVWADARFKLR